MSALLKSLKLVQKLGNAQQQPLFVYTAVKQLATWNKDFKPGNFPVTQKDCENAAKKYNMLPEEYKPYADDGLGYGDYPDLGHSLGIEAKDPYYPYDFPEHKRNLHEVVHADIDVYGEDRHSQPEPLRYPQWYYWTCFLGVMTGSFLIYFWLEDKKMFRPVAAKQYPGDGRVHYTFERNN